MTDTDRLPPLPPGYELEELLGERNGVWILRASHAGGQVALRLDTSADAQESLTELEQEMRL